jgi:hypothetical protein
MPKYIFLDNWVFCCHLIWQPEGSNHAVVPLSGVLLRGRIPREHPAPSRQWDFGHAFQSPFASPPGEGLSSSTINVLWGLFNLAVGYLLVCRVGDFSLRNTRHVFVLGAGILIMSLMLAHGFGRFHGGL